MLNWIWQSGTTSGLELASTAGVALEQADDGRVAFCSFDELFQRQFTCNTSNSKKKAENVSVIVDIWQIKQCSVAWKKNQLWCLSVRFCWPESCSWREQVSEGNQGGILSWCLHQHNLPLRLSPMEFFYLPWSVCHGLGHKMLNLKVLLFGSCISLPPPTRTHLHITAGVAQSSESELLYQMEAQCSDRGKNIHLWNKSQQVQLIQILLKELLCHFWQGLVFSCNFRTSKSLILNAQELPPGGDVCKF